MSEIFLGIDPGFHITGFAVLKLEQTVMSRTDLLDFGYLKMKPKDHLSKRTGIFYDLVLEKIKQYSITQIVLETPFLGKNAQTFLKLGYLRGILYLLADQHSLGLLEFSPTEVKVTITGFGRASKDQVAHMMMKMFPPLKDIKTTVRNDVTDALAICVCGVWKKGKE